MSKDSPEIEAVRRYFLRLGITGPTVAHADHVIEALRQADMLKGPYVGESQHRCEESQGNWIACPPDLCEADHLLTQNKFMGRQIAAMVPQDELNKALDSRNWARLLLERDDVQGRKVLERMIAYYEENDGKADDFGRLFIVTDANAALGRET